MADRSSERPEQAMDRTGNEMEKDLEHLEEHLDEARDKAPDATLQRDQTFGAAGDVGDQEGGPMFGDDPEGAVDDEDAG